MSAKTTIQEKLASMKRIKNKMDTLAKYKDKQDKDFHDIPSDEQLTKDEIILLLESGTGLLYNFGRDFILEKFDEEMLLVAINVSRNYMQYIPSEIQTTKISDLFLSKCTLNDFPSTLNPSLITEETFSKFCEENFSNLHTIVSKLKNNFFNSDKEIERLKIEEEQYNDTFIDNGRESGYELTSRFRLELVRLYEIMIKQDESFDLLKRMPSDLYPDMEFVIEKNMREFGGKDFLKNIPDTCQNKNIVEYALSLDLENINYASGNYINADITKEALGHYISNGGTTKSQNLHLKIEKFPEILTKEIVGQLFKMTNKSLFVLLADKINPELLDEAMIMHLLKTSFNSYLPDTLMETIKNKVTEEQVSLIVNKYGIKRLVEFQDMIPAEIFTKFYGEEDYFHELITQDGGKHFLEIPKDKQTQTLFNISINHPNYPLEEHQIVYGINHINPEFIDISIIYQALFDTGLQKSEDFIKNFVIPNLNNYTLNVKLSKIPSLWHLINPKFITDEKILLNMVNLEDKTGIEFIENLIIEKEKVLEMIKSVNTKKSNNK